MKAGVVYDLQDDRWIINLKQLNEGTNRKKVILTFDDGPSRHLNKILDILHQKNVQAIFFWQSRLFYQHRPWQRVLTDGHIIGSHAHNHKNLAKLSKDLQFKQIKGSINKIEAITKVKIRYFRPPFGQYNEDTMQVIKELDLIPIMWEITSYDWENKATPSRIVCNINNHLTDGAIILLHELEQTVAILPQLIDKIRDNGFDFTVF